MIIGSQECLSSDDGSEGLEKYLRDKFDSLSGEGIVEVDPTVVLELLNEKLVDRGSVGSNVVPGTCWQIIAND